MEEAVRWWEQAAAQGHVFAFVELAKHFEHRRRDYLEAKRWNWSVLAVCLLLCFNTGRLNWSTASNDWKESCIQSQQSLKSTYNSTVLV